MGLCRTAELDTEIAGRCDEHGDSWWHRFDRGIEGAYGAQPFGPESLPAMHSISTQTLWPRVHSRLRRRLLQQVTA